MRKVCCSYPELLDQVHIGSLILLHAALRDTGHVSSQCAINQYTQHVQHGCEELTVGREMNHRVRQIDLHWQQFVFRNK